MPDGMQYVRYDPTTVVHTKQYDPATAPSKRLMSSAVAIDPIAGMSTPLLLFGGKDEKGRPLDDIWIIDTTEVTAGTSRKNGMLYFDGVDDMIAIRLPKFVRNTRSTNGIWFETWMKLQMKGKINNVILFEAMARDTTVLRLALISKADQPFVRLIYFPGAAFARD